MENNPLVSIIVITYNSSAFILETLESIKTQTYKNIELIISDDSSTDKTIALCSNWLKTNYIHFKNVKIIQTPQNIGISGNCNHGLREASGEWIKYIAGDDMLTNNCIERFVEYAFIHTDSNFFSCDLEVFNDENHYYIQQKGTRLNKKNSKQQLKYFIGCNSRINGPSLFINRTALIKLGGFNEEFPMVEDYPLYIKITSEGNIIRFIPEILVRWRKNINSVTHSGHGIFITSISEFHEKILLPLYKENHLLLLYYHYFIHYKILKKNITMNIWLKRLILSSDPVYIYNYVRYKFIMRTRKKLP